MKINPTEPLNDDDMLPEYDFTSKKGVRGKHASVLREGYTVTVHQQDGTTLTQNFTLQEKAVVLDQDVRAYFPDSESVNRALRALIALIPEKRQSVGEGKAKYGSRES
jgi:hypothetical protein